MFKLHAFECWNQIEVILLFTSQHNSTLWSDGKIVRKEAEGLELSTEVHILPDSTAPRHGQIKHLIISVKEEP